MFSRGSIMRYMLLSYARKLSVRIGAAGWPLISSAQQSLLPDDDKLMAAQSFLAAEAWRWLVRRCGVACVRVSVRKRALRLVVLFALCHGLGTNAL